LLYASASSVCAQGKPRQLINIGTSSADGAPTLGSRNRISKYQRRDIDPTLCANDANILPKRSAPLRSFAEDHIHRLTNDQATIQNVRNRAG